jgi:3-keto steroid reductase
MDLDGFGSAIYLLTLSSCVLVYLSSSSNSQFTQFRALEPLLSKSPSRSRVVWTSSLEASPARYNPEDWQCKATSHSYETTKYEIDLIATFLDRLSLQDPTRKRPRHFVAQPGVCSTSISDALIGPVLNLVKLFLFYVVRDVFIPSVVLLLKMYQARLCGSPHHTITPFKAAISVVHIALAPLVFLTFLESHQPVRIGAQTDMRGNEYVGLTPVKEWKRFEMEAEYLLAKCNALYEKVKDRTKLVTVNEQAS